MSLSLRFYRSLMGALSHLLPAYLESRVKSGKEIKERLGERFGKAAHPRPQGSLIWLHGVSVGEALCATVIIDAYLKKWPDTSFLVTYGTITAAELLPKRLPFGVLHQFMPVDTPKAVCAFLDHWQPDFCGLIESDLWPNMSKELARRSIPQGFLSARLTEKTHHRWGIFKGAVRELMAGFSLVWPQDEFSKNALLSVGAKVEGLINLKTFGTPLTTDENDLKVMQKACEDRFVIVVASTHQGEDFYALEALKSSLSPNGDKNFLIILIPRHPARAHELLLDLNALGHDAQLRTREPIPRQETRIYIADTLGEMGLFYRLSDLIILGGSLIPNIGGHNPYEPARLGKAVISGKHVFKWQGAFDDLGAKDGVMIAHDQESLGYSVESLISHPNALMTMNENAKNAAYGDEKALEALVLAINKVVMHDD